MTHPAPFGLQSQSIQWIAIIGLSAALSFGFVWIHMPAALLLGPLIGAATFSVAGATFRLPDRAFALAQGVIGCMIATMLPTSISDDTLADWPLFIIGVVSVIGLAGLLGWAMMKMEILPGSTVVWGLSPGGASVMILMAEHYKADTQIVALMQYVRVVMVIGIASLIAKLAGGSFHAAPEIAWLKTPDWPSFAATIALAVSGPLLAKRLRLSAGALLIPLTLGFLLTHRGWITIELPPLLLALAYACIGWRIGSRFTRPLLVHAAKVMPRIIVCSLILIASCAALGGVLVLVAGIDPMTAYLATTPGGVDAAAIIAASGHVDQSFVMAMQTARFLVVLLLGPMIGQFFAGRIGRTKSSDISED